jgi:hypothetical protein
MKKYVTSFIIVLFITSIKKFLSKNHPCFSSLPFLAGKKLMILSLVFFLLPAKVIISQLTDSPWPMYQGDSRHTGKSKYAGIRKPSIAWSYKICDDSWVVGDMVVGIDGTIYIPVSNGIFIECCNKFTYLSSLQTELLKKSGFYKASIIRNTHIECNRHPN